MKSATHGINKILYCVAVQEAVKQGRQSSERSRKNERENK